MCVPAPDTYVVTRTVAVGITCTYLKHFGSLGRPSESSYDY